MRMRESTPLQHFVTSAPLMLQIGAAYEYRRTTMRPCAYNGSVMVAYAYMLLCAYNDMVICRYAPMGIKRQRYKIVCGKPHKTVV
jgi:hypothetical protein